ncbi:hypothetical protein BDR03DRAFT_957910 [Suillus americanus]|nr:hypothetical protein BDR03DRAFT_957910 [Suillus americanus]
MEDNVVQAHDNDCKQSLVLPCIYSSRPLSLAFHSCMVIYGFLFPSFSSSPRFSFHPSHSNTWASSLYSNRIFIQPFCPFLFSFFTYLDKSPRFSPSTFQHGFLFLTMAGPLGRLLPNVNY